MENKIAQIHRFGDCVAIYIGGETVYLTPKDSKNLAKALNACASDCKSLKFVESQFRTKLIDLNDTGYNGSRYKIKRG